MLESVSQHYHIPFDVPVGELSKHQMDIILYGGKKGDTITVNYVNNEGHDRRFQTNYEGVIPNLQRRYRETTSDYIRSELERYMTSRPCPTCSGKRLRPEALAVTITDRNIDEASHYVGDGGGAVDRAAGGRERMAEWRERERRATGERESLAVSHACAGPLRRQDRLSRASAARLAAQPARLDHRPADPEGTRMRACASWWTSGWTT